MEMTLEVNGMTCEHCQKTVKDTVENLEGVHGAEVHLDSGKVNVVYDEAYVGKNLIKESIHTQGYEVVG